MRVFVCVCGVRQISRVVPLQDGMVCDRAQAHQTTPAAEMGRPSLLGKCVTQERSSARLPHRGNTLSKQESRYFRQSWNDGAGS